MAEHWSFVRLLGIWIDSDEPGNRDARQLLIYGHERNGSPAGGFAQNQLGRQRAAVKLAVTGKSDQGLRGLLAKREAVLTNRREAGRHVARHGEISESDHGQRPWHG